jgi:hypothetical protein
MQDKLPVIRDGSPARRSHVVAAYVSVLEGRIVAYIRNRLAALQRRSSFIPAFPKQSELPV